MPLMIQTLMLDSSECKESIGVRENQPEITVDDSASVNIVT